MMISLGGAVCLDGVITDGMFSLHLVDPPLVTPSLSGSSNLYPLYHTHYTTLVPDQTWSLTDVRLAVTELLNCCLAEWIVSGHPNI